MEKWILLGMAPIFLGLIGLEAWYWRRRRPQIYSLADTVSNAGLALMHQASEALAAILVIGDEILSGRTKDRNIGTIADFLTALGIDLREVRVVADDHDAIVAALRALSGYRGKEPGDLDALAQALVSLSRLAVHDGPAVADAEINPLIVRPKGQGVVAVDALVKLV